MKLAQRRVSHAYVLAWSSWRRAHQANGAQSPSQAKIVTIMLVRAPDGTHQDSVIVLRGKYSSAISPLQK
ncbi:hypothetical protein EAS61_28900 [Bradyrhizobium zhanjiangense]|uniref:Uncharacterized protein n=1 Tax=Bradyrhizobium zhanjiangense TaxID=1325107 RepID=A0A4Q0QDJ3_9BRAD|nr:hypothetical protein EAS61_28900 [Bradyrhizobium zhanjiangense]RXG96401.1 hypothetical protein EAS62_12555 [Bradyrhizobium zhanjiangense]